MSLKEKFFTKVFSEEGTEQSKEATKPMKPESILPIFQIALAVLAAIICMTPIAINVINQGGL